jgi:hypothetical protein
VFFLKNVITKTQDDKAKLNYYTYVRRNQKFRDDTSIIIGNNSMVLIKLGKQRFILDGNELVIANQHSPPQTNK